MNRTDRMLAILLELQARRYTRGEDLAGQFEVSVRTIYRDVLALCEAGVPVISTPGYGYSLAPGYFLPPVMLTADEAGMLLLGASFVADHVDAPYKQVVESGRKKIEKLLPEQTRQEVDFLQESLRFANMRPPDPAVEKTLGVIRRAINEREVLHIAYQARHGDPGERDVEPHGLIYVNNSWMMAAYCRSRQDMRSFRLERIDRLEPRGEQFTRRNDFTIRQPPEKRLGALEVQALFDHETARWVRENQHFSFTHEDERPDGVLMFFRPRRNDEILSWLLSWGAGVRVVSPPDLRDQLVATVRAIAAQYE